MDSTELTPSSREKPQIAHFGFLFNKKYAYQSHSSWKCSFVVCNINAKTSINEEEFIRTFVCLNNNHNHEPQYGKIMSKKLINKMKDLIIQEDREPRYIINKILRGSGHNTIALFPNFESICKMLRRYRIKMKNPKPWIYPTLKVGTNLNTTVLNAPFYQYGVDKYENFLEKDDILIFYGDHAITRLYPEDVWCVDGTFSVVPAPYYQLYTISFIKNNLVFPTVFALLKNKRLSTYRDLFRILIAKRGFFSPQ